MPVRPVALLCTSNGVGLGHVTRMMAVADALAPDVDVVLFTLSAAISIPTRAGLAVEHLVAADQLAVRLDQWHDLLEDRTTALIERYRPSAVVFDGVVPYRGFVSALAPHRKRLRRIWQRRAMWRPGIGHEAMKTEPSFDHVIEPGDYAAAYDRGLTVAHRDAAIRVGPIVYKRHEAPPWRPADGSGTARALVQLGAGHINDVHSLTGRVVQALRSHSDVRVTVARSELAAHGLPAEDVAVLRRFPLTPCYSAFDFAVLAAGYNSFHEALATGTPAIFVPNLATRTDDQDGRSRWASDHGMARRWDGRSDLELAQAIEWAVEADERRAVRARLETLPPADGADEVARCIRSWL